MPKKQDSYLPETNAFMPPTPIITQLHLGHNMAHKTTIELDPSVYSSSAVLATSYWYADRFIISVEASSPSLRIVIVPKEDNLVDQSVIDDFIVRLTDNELRKRLRNQFAQLETIIVQKAFAPVSK